MKETSENSIKKKDKILCIKLPAKVNNVEKAIYSIGGNSCVFEKFKNDQDLDLNLLFKNIPLEKCFSNDLLLRRKTYRNKNDPNVKKNVYEIVGKMDSQYEYFALHDFIYITDKRNDFQNSLEKEVIDLDPYFNNKTSDSLEKLLNDKIDDIQLKDGKFENLVQYLQPNSFTYKRYLYPYPVKELKESLYDSDS